MRYAPHTAALGALAATITLASAAAAQRTAPHAARHESAAQLARDARITPDSARALALREVPGGRVQSSELERERGALIYWCWCWSGRSECAEGRVTGDE